MIGLIQKIRKHRSALSRREQLALSQGAWAAFLLLLVAVVSQVASEISIGNASIQAWDESVLVYIQSIRTPFWNLMMLDISALGGLANTVLFGVIATVLFIIAKDYWAAIHYFITVAGGYGISILIKGMLERPRPSVVDQLVRAGGYSYPSGHAVTIAAGYVTLGLLASRYFRSWGRRLMVIYCVAIIVSLVGFSRLYLGVHYPSDVLSGICIGSAWAIGTGILFARSHFSFSQTRK